MSNQLFDKTISSISYSQNEILSDIKTLFLNGEQFQMDATFGYGGFYPDGNYPEFCYDTKKRKHKNKNLIICSALNLPNEKESIKSSIIDPPFVVTTHIDSEEYHMGEKYGSYSSITELRQTYYGIIGEQYRVLKKGGYLVIKCQDFIHGKKAYFFHNEVLDIAKLYGMIPVDLFILLSKNRFIGNIKTQKHARKFHSYFWVFRK